jgi:hypothetical protein
MACKGKFAATFAEPQQWGDCWLVARKDGETQAEGAARFTEFFESHDPDYLPINPKRLSESTVRMQLVSREYYEWWDENQVNGRCAVWCLGETGRGAKPVWVLE